MKRSSLTKSAAKKKAKHVHGDTEINVAKNKNKVARAMAAKKKLLRKKTEPKSESKDEIDFKGEAEDVSEDEEMDGDQMVGDTQDEQSVAQVEQVNSHTTNTAEPHDEGSAEEQLKADEEQGVSPSDVFYERFFKKMPEEEIRKQIQQHEKLAQASASLSHKLLGTIVATGAVAKGAEGAVGIVRDGLEGTTWLATDGIPRDLLHYGIRHRFLANFASASGSQSKLHHGMTPHQQALSAMLLSYADVAYHCETTENHMEIIQCYALHAFNHIYRARMATIRNNLLRKSDSSAEITDQGFTRPRVLILTPLRNTAYDVVKFLCNLQQSEVHHNATFEKKFSPVGRKVASKSKPLDHQHRFRGNVDDMFTLGITMKNDTSLNLDATNLYHADILVASPVALRLLIGAPGDKKRNFDFLSSIDMLIVDQADMMLMQNWSYLSLIFDHLNLKPTTVRPGMDFSRTNEWALSDLSAHRRQTIIFSAFPAPDINALFSRKYSYGKIRISEPPSGGVIERVVPQIRQTFQRLECSNDIVELDDQRFKLFSEEIFPHLSSTLTSRVLLLIPSYFDYLRVRELFQKEREPFCRADEYMKPIKVQSQCNTFGKKNMKWLLCTERCYYYNRIPIPKIRHVVFYSPPLFAQFYPEFLNTIVSNDSTCLVLYSKFEKLQLERLVGNSRTQKMLTSNKSTFLFC